MNYTYLFLALLIGFVLLKFGRYWLDLPYFYRSYRHQRKCGMSINRAFNIARKHIW